MTSKLLRVCGLLLCGLIVFSLIIPRNAYTLADPLDTCSGEGVAAENEGTERRPLESPVTPPTNKSAEEIAKGANNSGPVTPHSKKANNGTTVTPSGNLMVTSPAGVTTSGPQGSVTTPPGSLPIHLLVDSNNNPYLQIQQKNGFPITPPRGDPPPGAGVPPPPTTRCPVVSPCEPGQRPCPVGKACIGSPANKNPFDSCSCIDKEKQAPKSGRISYLFTPTQQDSSEQSEMMAQLGDFAASSIDDESGAGAVSTSAAPLRNGLPPGFHFWSSELHAMFLLTQDLTMVIGYFADGRRAMWQWDGLLNYFELTWVKDIYENIVEYAYYPDGRISMEVAGGVAHVYTYAGSTQFPITRIETWLWSGKDRTGDPIVVPNLTQEITYNAQGNPVSISDYKNEFVQPARSSGQYADLSDRGSERRLINFAYDSAGRLTSIQEQYPNANLTFNRLGIGWTSAGTVDRTVDYQNIVTRYSYLTGSMGERIIRLTKPESVVDVSFEQNRDLVIEDKIVPLWTPRRSSGDQPAEMLSRAIRVSRDPSCACGLPQSITDLSNNSTVSLTWDPVSGQIVGMQMPSPTGVGNVTRTWSYGSFWDGSPLTSETDELGLQTSYEITYGSPGDPYEPGFPISQITVRPPAAPSKGGAVSLAHTLGFDSSGALIWVYGPLGTTEYQYDYDPRVMRELNPTTNRGLLMRIVTGVGTPPDPAAASTQVVTFSRNDSLGEVTSIQTPESIWSYAYDGLGRVVRVTQGQGNGAREVSYAFGPWDSWGAPGIMLLKSKNSLGQRQTDLSGNAGDGLLRFEQHFAASGLLTELIRPRNLLASSSSVSQDSHQIIRFDYDSAGNTARVSTDGHEITYTYDGYGDLYTTTAQAVGTSGPPIEKHYRTASEISRATLASVVNGAAQYTQTIAHLMDNGASQLKSLDLPNGTQARYSYDRRGYRIGTQIFQGTRVLSQSSQEYDSVGRLINLWTHDPSSASTRFNLQHLDYSMAGLPEDITNQLGVKTTLGYDNLGRIISTSTSGAVQSLEYVPHGKKVSRSTTRTGGNSYVTQYQYNALGDLSVLSDLGLNGAQPARSYSVIYDSLGQATAVTQPDGTVMDSLPGIYLRLNGTIAWSLSTHFDSQWNRILEVIAPNGSVTRSTYNQLGLKVSEQLPGIAPTQFSYDTAFNLVSVLDPNGALQTFSYDSIGRLVQRLWSTNRGDSATRSYSWGGPGGMLSSVLFNSPQENWSAEKRYTYDNLLRLASVEDRMSGLPTEVMRFGYTDRSGRESLTQLQTLEINPSTTIRYTYDSTTGLVSSVGLQNPASGVPSGLVNFSTVAGRLQTISSGGLVENLLADSYGRLSSRIVQDSKGAVLTGYQASYTSTGNPVTVADFGNPQGGNSGSYTFDLLGRLTAYQRNSGATAGSAPYSEKIEIDPRTQLALSRTVTDRGANRRDQFSIDSSRWVTSSMNGAPISYDGSLRMTADPARTYSYNPLGQLSAASSGTIQQNFRYDAVGQLALRTDESGLLIRERFLADFPYAEEDTQGNIKGIYIPNPYSSSEPLVYLRNSGGRWQDYYPKQGATSPMSLLAGGQSNPVAESYYFDASGKERAYSGSSASAREVSALGFNRGFKNMLQLGKNLYSTAFRSYNATTGTWMSPDPLHSTENMGAPLSALGMNPANSDYLGLQSSGGGGFLTGLYDSFAGWVSGGSYSPPSDIARPFVVAVDNATAVIGEITNRAVNDPARAAVKLALSVQGHDWESEFGDYMDAHPLPGTLQTPLGPINDPSDLFVRWAIRPNDPFTKIGESLLSTAVTAGLTFGLPRRAPTCCSLPEVKMGMPALAEDTAAGGLAEAIPVTRGAHGIGPSAVDAEALKDIASRAEALQQSFMAVGPRSVYPNGVSTINAVVNVKSGRVFTFYDGSVYSLKEGARAALKCGRYRSVSFFENFYNADSLIPQQFVKALVDSGLWTPGAKDPESIARVVQIIRDLMAAKGVDPAKIIQATSNQTVKALLEAAPRALPGR